MRTYHATIFNIKMKNLKLYELDFNQRFTFSHVSHLSFSHLSKSRKEENTSNFKHGLLSQHFEN